MGMSCTNCKYSIFYPTVGKYKCIKHDCFSEDICNEYKFSADIDEFDEFDGLAADGKEDGEED